MEHAIIDYQKGGIKAGENFISFVDIEGTSEDPKSIKEIEKTLTNFFEKNGVTYIRDPAMTGQVGPSTWWEWLEYDVLANHPSMYTHPALKSDTMTYSLAGRAKYQEMYTKALMKRMAGL